MTPTLLLIGNVGARMTSKNAIVWRLPVRGVGRESYAGGNPCSSVRVAPVYKLPAAETGTRDIQYRKWSSGYCWCYKGRERECWCFQRGFKLGSG